ncbi:MAG TPA: hypothetical protein GXX51_04035 [Firmicutes bacterium]|nr:hypothetical protein [Bacillota bacterium]
MRLWRFLRNTLVALAIFWILGHLNAMNTSFAQRVKGYVIYALTAEVDFRESLSSLRDLATRLFEPPARPGK